MGFSCARRPGAIPAPYVDLLWYCEHESSSAGEAVLPTGRAQIAFGLDPAAPQASVQASVQGPTSVARIIDTTVQTRAVGVSFRSGGLTAILDGPLDALVDELVDVSELLPDGAALHQRLAEAPGSGSVLCRLETHLAGTVAPGEGVRRVHRPPGGAESAARPPYEPTWSSPSSEVPSVALTTMPPAGRSWVRR